MKKKAPFLLFPLLLLLSFCTRAQTYNIIKSQAYYRTSTAGTIPVDESGNPTSKGVSKDYLIFIETTGSVLPQWETAYIDGLPYAVRTVEVANTPVKLSPLKGQSVPVTVSKGSGNRLWQLALAPQQSESEQRGQTHDLILSGTFRSKPFTYRINNVQELAKRFNQ